MNRRSFLGFAVGGAILVGERVEGFPKPAGMTTTDVALRQAQQVSVMSTGADGDARVRRLVQEGVQKALAEQRTFAHRKGP
ncbi:hypothetical protein GHK50_33615 [Sinorhizobium medicae]|uniref:Uncharacterized protein n=1 Tax=Sinorhizobium medicae TaxID=110321 RepID=A0A6G1WVG1_9HYPH|nr:hypothetical protein [Sinorhizobium medicae]MQW73642.1 hypothetical protein [Sinorhizobium medicae]MQX87778.1 hypothetical protein [Sinorhizobium medicae]RVJ52069.1 hypothetical protein CN166_26500 [Sinorhizobium medicae]RVK11288.1 hypothetical protein CN165_27575 [Sinorhizobium medicae]